MTRFLFFAAAFILITGAITGGMNMLKQEDIPTAQSQKNDEGKTKSAKLAEDTDILLSKIHDALDDPCNSDLRFTKLWGDWHVALDGYGAYPADRIWPRKVLDEVEKYAVKNRITFRQLCRAVGY